MSNKKISNALLNESKISVAKKELFEMLLKSIDYQKFNEIVQRTDILSKENIKYQSITNNSKNSIVIRRNGQTRPTKLEDTNELVETIQYENNGFFDINVYSSINEKNNKLTNKEYINGLEKAECLSDKEEYEKAKIIYESLAQKSNHWKPAYRAIFCIKRLGRCLEASNKLNILIHKIEKDENLTQNEFLNIDFFREKNSRKKSAIEPPRKMNYSKILADCWNQKANLAIDLEYSDDIVIYFYQKAREYNPKDPIININLLKRYYETQRYEEAQNLFDKNKNSEVFFKILKQIQRYDKDSDFARYIAIL